jgi:hypothetical protein
MERKRKRRGKPGTTSLLKDFETFVCPADTYGRSGGFFYLPFRGLISMLRGAAV